MPCHDAAGPIYSRKEKPALYGSESGQRFVVEASVVRRKQSSSYSSGPPYAICVGSRCSYGEYLSALLGPKQLARHGRRSQLRPHHPFLLSAVLWPLRTWSRSDLPWCVRPSLLAGGLPSLRASYSSSGLLRRRLVTGLQNRKG